MDVVVYGALNGKIESLESGIDGITVDGTTLHFEFTDGTSADMEFPTPADGVSITNVTVNSQNHLICTLSNNTSLDAGLIPTVQGETGATGATGASGVNGRDGTNGTNGIDGQDGASAYEIAVSHGYEGTEVEWLVSLKGAKGDTGEKGDTGDTGAQGQAGEDGQDGTNGTNGIDGVNGTDGFSPTITESSENTQNTYKLDITTVDGTFTTPNLKGAGEGGGSVSSVDGDTGDVILHDIKYTTQTLTNEQKAQARSNIGAGTSNFSGDYTDLINKPTNVTIDDTALGADKVWSSNKVSSELSGKLSASALSAHTDDTDIHVTTSDKTAWNNKADTATTYNKNEVNSLLSNKANSADVNAHTGDASIHVTAEDKTTWDATLSSANAYTDSVFANVSSLNVEIVAELPTENINTHAIYFVPKTAETNDSYDEYMYINSQWEHIGSTSVDLSNYYTKAEMNMSLGNKVDKVSGKALSTNDYSNADKSKLDSIETSANNYLLPTASAETLGGIKLGTRLTSVNGVVDVNVADKANTTHTHTTADVTNFPDSMPASDVSEWAKAENKPTYSKSEVGLGNVDNTSDLNKPVSTAQQTALDGKVDKVTGKNLSTNDYTTEDKNKLAGVATGANNYTLPAASNNALGGIKIGGRTSISNGILNIDVSDKANATDLATHTTDTVIHVTASDKATWNAMLGTAESYAEALFANVTGFNVVVVNVLPTENIDVHAIYFVPKTGTENDNYDEYMYLNSQWEHIGSTTVDLDNYYTKAQVDNKLTGDNISYSNTTSGMAATSVQGAVDELAGRGSPYIYMTQAEYEAIKPITGQKYWVTYPLSGCYLVWLNGEAIDGIGASPVAGYELAYSNSSYKSYGTLVAKRLALAYSPEGLGGSAENDFTHTSRKTLPLLEKADIAKGVTYLKKGAFANTTLNEISLPEGLLSIGPRAFAGCTNLTSITIPSTVIGIYSTTNYVTGWQAAAAFSSCANLTDFNFAGTIEQWNNVTLGSSWNYNCTFTVVHCSDGGSTRLS